MSRRFGRNQRRKAREELAAAQADIQQHKFAAHVAALDWANQRERADRLEQQLRDAKAYLGRNSPAFPPEGYDFGYKPYRDDRLYLPVREDQSEAVAMQVVRRDSEDMRDQVHFLLFAGPEQWGYAITKRALASAPREVIARHIVVALVDMMLDKMNTGGRQ